MPVPTVPAAPTLPRIAFRVAEVARMLGIPKSSVHELIQRGELGSHRYGVGLKRKRVFVTQKQIDAFLERTRLVARRCA